MKKMIYFAILFSFVGLAHGRQYNQCSLEGSFDRMVINLDGENSTLFKTDGVHRQDEQRSLKDLFFKEGTNQFSIYETLEVDGIREEVKIANQYIGVRHNGFEVELTTYRGDSKVHTLTYSCFSAIYNQ